jgi:hypothetical protein
MEYINHHHGSSTSRVSDADEWEYNTERSGKHHDSKCDQHKQRCKLFNVHNYNNDFNSNLWDDDSSSTYVDDDGIDTVFRSSHTAQSHVPGLEWQLLPTFTSACSLCVAHASAVHEWVQCVECV